MYSLFLISFTIFSIAVSLLLLLRLKQLGISHYMVGAALWGLGIAGIGMTKYGGIIAGFSMLVGVGIPIASLSRVFMLQDKVPDAMRGRAFSFSAVFLYFSNTVSLALFGSVSRIIPTEILFDVAGTAIFFIAGVYLSLVKFAPLRRRHRV